MKHEGDKNDTTIRMMEPGIERPVKPFVGCVVCEERGDDEREVVKAIVLRVNKKSVSGIFLDGISDSTYRYCNFVKVKTRKGWSYRAKKRLRMLGWVDGDRLQEAIDKADTGEEFGSGEYSPA